MYQFLTTPNINYRIINFRYKERMIKRSTNIQKVTESPVEEILKTWMEKSTLKRDWGSQIFDSERIKEMLDINNWCGFILIHRRGCNRDMK